MEMAPVQIVSLFVACHFIFLLMERACETVFLKNLLFLRDK